MSGPSSTSSFAQSLRGTAAIEDHPDAPSSKSICSRYYRATLLLGLHTGARDYTQLTVSCPSFAYRRSKVWLLKLIEEIYDEAYKVEAASAGKMGGVHVSAKERERKAALKTAFLTVEGENISNTIILPGGDGANAEDAVFGVSMPSLIVQFMCRTLGTRNLVNQTVIDMMVCVELNRKYPEVELFSLFLRELYDEDCFAFFLHSRNLVVERLGLCLSDLNQRVYPDNVSKLNLKEGAVMVRSHEAIKHISRALVNKEQVVWLLRKIIPATSEGGDLHGETVHSIRRHVLWMIETKNSLFETLDGPTRILADGSYEIDRYLMGDLFLILKLLVDEFAQTAEAIVKELKFNDDGYRLTMLEMLQETVKDDEKLKEARAKVDEAKHALSLHLLTMKKSKQHVDQVSRHLQDAQLRKNNEEEIKLETELGQAKTAVFLMKNETFKLQSDLSMAEKELHGIEFHHNKVWEDIITNEQVRICGLLNIYFFLMCIFSSLVARCFAPREKY